MSHKVTHAVAAQQADRQAGRSGAAGRLEGAGTASKPQGKQASRARGMQPQRRVRRGSHPRVPVNDQSAAARDTGALAGIVGGDEDKETRAASA
jgi:hypothetical protein